MASKEICEYCGHPKDSHIKDATGKYKEVCIEGAVEGNFCLCREFAKKEKKNG
jgi:hypothetical protein